MKSTIKLNILGIGVIIALFAIVSLLMFVNKVKADATTTVAQTNLFKDYTFFATTTTQTIFATSTTATSTAITAWFNSNGERDNGSFVVAGAKNVTFYFKRGDTLGTGNTGSHAFRPQFTPKINPTEADWYYFNDWISATSTDLYSTTISLTGTSTSQVGMDMVGRSFYAVRCIAVETTDGDFQCSATAQY